MHGYQLVEQKTLGTQAGGIKPNAEEIGLLDFLRELSEEQFPFPRFSELRVVGLEEVLFASRPEEERLAAEIRRRLKQAASDLEGRLMSVQVVFKGTLKRGDSLWVEYRGQRLPIDRIFISPTRETDANGNEYFYEHFNLT